MCAILIGEKLEGKKKEWEWFPFTGKKPIALL